MAVRLHRLTPVFISRPWLAVLLFVGILFSPLSSYATDKLVTQFEATPNRCVTLRQGQPCFVRVKFQWQTSEAVQACLLDIEGTKIKCWPLALTGSIELSQTLPNTAEYILTDIDGVEIDRTSVVVSWVYRKKRSKRRWRLF